MKQTSFSNRITRREFARRSAACAAGLAGLAKGVARAATDAVDYIVVGSGPGGGPLAVNLALAGYKVVLMEAGPAAEDLNGLMSLPIFSPSVAANPEVAWNYYVRHYANETQQRADSKYVSAKGGIFYPRASTIGGCSVHNVLVMMAANNSDWDGIASVTGDPSWSADNMRPYFHRIEQCRYIVRPSDGGQDPLDHGFDGWQPTEMLDTSIFTADPQLNTILQSAANQIGTPSTMSDYAQNKLDPNAKAVLDKETEGLYAFPMSRLNGVRRGIRERILETATALPNNLIIMTNALVTRVLFNGTTAIGVEYLPGNATYRASPLASPTGPEPAPRQQLMASREVIISAGTFNSPQILKLSGIGPAAELSKFGIKQIVNLAGVGSNLQDRYEVGVVTELAQNFTILQRCTPQQPNDPCFADFLQGRGIYTTNLSALASIRKSDPAKLERDLVVFCAAGDFHGYYPGWENETYGTPNQFTWLILKAHPANRSGTVTLSSADPRDPPVINFHYFAEGNDTAGDDLNAVVKGVQLARQLNSQLGQIAIGERLPGPSVQSAQDIANFVSNEAWGHHASCSNKMGPASDPMAVVDSNFKVHGTKNLRIVDASVFPRIPGYYVMIPIMMISERASDFIIYDAKH